MTTVMQHSSMPHCITLRTDLVHTVEIVDIVYGISWKSRRMSGMRRDQEVKLYLPKTSEIIYIP